MMNAFLSRTFLGNSLESWLWFAGILITGIIFKRILSSAFSWILYKIFQRYGRQVGAGTFIRLLSAPVGLSLMVLIVYLACNRLSFPEEWHIGPKESFGIRFILQNAFEGATALSLTWVIIRVVEFIGLVYQKRASYTPGKMDDQLAPFIKQASKILVAIVGFMVFLAVTFNLDVVSLVAGLGIGGLAIALAAKETLENLFGSFTIFLDRPFVVGDYVKAGDVEGTVESIGFRSTKIRAPERMMVTVPNKNMVDAELINDTERSVRRARFVIGLTYAATPEQMRNVIRDFREYLQQHPSLEPGSMVYFQQFGTSSLDILINYFVKTPDSEEFLKIQEEINFNLMDIVMKNHCEFAYPSRTLYLRNDDAGIDKEGKISKNPIM